MADVLEIARRLDALIIDTDRMIEEHEAAGLAGEDNQLERMALRGERLGLILAKRAVLRT